MTRKRDQVDLSIRLQGLGAPDGTLGWDDLLQLGKLLKGLESASPSLAGGVLCQVRKGSSRPEIRFPRSSEASLPGMDPIRESLLGLFNEGGYSSQDGWRLPKEVRECLGHWGKKGVTVGVSVPRPLAKPFSFRFTPKKIKDFSAFVAEEPVRRVLQGRIRTLDGADNEFELHFDKQRIICPFPEGHRPSGLFFEKFAEVVVMARSRPVQGGWRALSTISFRLLPEAPHLDLQPLQVGMVPPTIHLPGGFHLNDFFGGVTPEDVDALCKALSLSET